MGVVNGVSVYAIPEDYLGLIQDLTSPTPSRPAALRKTDLAKVADLPPSVSICGVDIPLSKLKEMAAGLPYYNLTLRRDAAKLLFYDSIESALESPDKPPLMVTISCYEGSSPEEVGYDPLRTLTSLLNETYFVAEVAEVACDVSLPRPKLIRIDELNAWILMKPRWEYTPIIWERVDEPGAIYAGCKPVPLAGSVTLIAPFENLWLEYRISGWSDVSTMLEMAKGLASAGL